MEGIEGIEAISGGSKAENLPDLQNLKEELSADQGSEQVPEEVASEAANLDTANISPEALEQLQQ